jgi:L,D-transpeptidase catalytic domain
LRIPLAALAVLLGLAAAPRAEAADSAGAVSLDPALLGRFEAAGIPAQPLAYALRAFACGQTRGEFAEPILTLVDYSLPSTEERLWVLDLAEGAVRFHALVSHGRESGLRQAVAFSNVPGSKQSSLGLFRTDETYFGRHGYSLRLVGLEPGVNDLAYERNIVVHGADYATPTFASKHGRLGRSWGCPALDPALHRDVIDTIRGGSALFAYYPDARWLASSAFLRCETAPATPPPSRLSRRDLLQSGHRSFPLAPLAALVGR